MIKLTDFGTADRKVKKELLKKFILPDCTLITYELSHLIDDYFDDDNLGDIVSGLRHIYRNEINDILDSCIKATVFKYACRKHINDSENIIFEAENMIDSVYKKDYGDLDNDLIDELNKEIGYCLFADVDPARYNYLKDRIIQKNHSCYCDGAFCNAVRTVMWYKYNNADEVIDDWERTPCCYLLLTQNEVENYYAAFKTEENANTYDVYIYLDSDNEMRYKEIIREQFPNILMD